MPFSTRELAILLWLLALVAIALFSTSLRRGLLAVVHAALRPRLVIVVILAAGTIVAFVSVLKRWGFWTGDLAKDTALWFVFSGLSAIFRGVSDSDGKSPLWKQILLDQLKIAILIEYIVGTYTFSLLIEILLQPATAVLGMLIAIAERDAKTHRAAAVFRGMLALVGLIVLVSAFWKGWAERGSVDGRTVLRSLALTPLLAIAILPVSYAMALVSTYENLFFKLRIGPPKTAAVARYAKWRFFLRFRHRRTHVLAFMRAHASDIVDITTKADVDALLSQDS